MSTAPELLSFAQYARATNQSASRVYKTYYETPEDVPPVIKVGNVLKIVCSDPVAWIRARTEAKIAAALAKAGMSAP